MIVPHLTWLPSRRRALAGAVAFPVTVNASEVSGTSNDFPIPYRLSDARTPPEFWQAMVYADGGDVRFRVNSNPDSAELPFDMPWCDRDAEDGIAWIKGNISSGADFTFWVHCGNPDVTLYSPSVEQGTLTNPSAEADVTGWTNTTGAIARGTTSPLPAYEGGGYFFGGTVGETRAHQDVSIPVGHHVAIDAGERAVRLRWLATGFSLADFDRGEVEVEFFNGSGVSLGSRVGSGLWDGQNEQWEEIVWQVDIPATARTVRVSMHAVRTSGTNSNGCFDELELYYVERKTSDRWATWSAYRDVFLFGATGTDNRTGRMRAYTRGAARMMRTVSESPDVGGHQGIAVDPADPTHVFVIDTNQIRFYTVTGGANGTYAGATWALTATNNDPAGQAGVASNKHCSNGVVYNSTLVIPITDSVTPAMRLARFTADANLTFIDQTDISAQGDSCSDLTYHAGENRVYNSFFVSNGDVRAMRLGYYDADTFAFGGYLSLSRQIEDVQGLEWFDNRFWIASDADDGIYEVRADGTVLNSKHGGAVTNLEGLSNNGTHLVALFDNGGFGANVVELADDRRDYFGGGLTFPGQAAQKFAVINQFNTTFTWGITVKVTSEADSRALISWVRNLVDSNSVRVSLAYRVTGDALVAWDAANTFLTGSGHTVNTEYRVFLTYAGTGTNARKLYVNGALVAQGDVTTAKPGSPADQMQLGAEDADALERMIGDLGLWVVSYDAKDADWIANDYKAHYDQANFLTIGGV